MIFQLICKTQHASSSQLSQWENEATSDDGLREARAHKHGSCGEAQRPLLSAALTPRTPRAADTAELLGGTNTNTYFWGWKEFLYIVHHDVHVSAEQQFQFSLGTAGCCPHGSAHRQTSVQKPKPPGPCVMTKLTLNSFRTELSTFSTVFP